MVRRGRRSGSRGLTLLVLATLACSVVPAAPARAGLDLTWGAPNGAGGDTSITFGCSDPDSVAVLYACFQVPDTVRAFSALTALIDVRAEADTLPPFWRFDGDHGCNPRGIAISGMFPEGAGDSLENPYDNCAELIGAAASPPETSTPSRARIVCARVRTTPTTLLPGHNYFAFALRFFMDKSREAAGACEGCRIPVVIHWRSAVFEEMGSMQAGDFKHPLEVVESGLRGSCVRANGAVSAECDRPSPGPRTGTATR